MCAMNGDIRPDREFRTDPRDPEFARKLAAAKKEPLDHIVSADRHSSEVTVSSFADVFKARSYQKGLPGNLVTFEDEGDPGANEQQVNAFVHRVEYSLKPYDPESHLQDVANRISRLRQDLNEVGSSNLRRFLDERLQEVTDGFRALMQSHPVALPEAAATRLKQSLWAVDVLGRMLALKQSMGINPPYMHQGSITWGRQPPPAWSQELAPAVEAIRNQPLESRHLRVAQELREVASYTKLILDRLAKN